MALTNEQVHLRVRQKLGDLQFPTVVWSYDRIQAALTDGLYEFSNKRPNRQTPVSAVLVVASDSYRATVEVTTQVSTTGFLKFLAVEYPLNYDPRSYVGWIYRPETTDLELEMNAVDGLDGEACLVHWGKVHVCGDTSNTIPDEYLDVFSDLIVAKLVRAQAPGDPKMLSLYALAQADLGKVTDDGPAVKAVFRNQGW